MAYAKLSGALLVRKDVALPVQEMVSVPHVVPTPSSLPTPSRTPTQADTLLAHHLKALKLPTFLSEYERLAQQWAAAEGLDRSAYLLRLVEAELHARERRVVERRIKQARFPAVKSLDTFDFAAIPSLDKDLVLTLAQCEYVARRENVIAMGEDGTGKTHVAIGLGLAACQKGLSVGFITGASLMNELLDARDERRLLRLKRRLAAYSLLIIDEARLRAALDRCRRAIVRCNQPALRARFHDRHQQSSVRGVDQRIRDGAIDRCGARPADPPGPHPPYARRELSAEG